MMGLSLGHDKVVVLKLVTVVVAAMVSSTAYASGNFFNEFESTFGGDRVKISGQSGEQLSLALDQSSGSGFKSKKEYLFGRVDMQVKLVAGNSAGTVTTLYVSHLNLSSLLLQAHIYDMN